MPDQTNAQITDAVRQTKVVGEVPADSIATLYQT